MKQGCSPTYKHGGSCSNLRPVALEELDDWDVVEVQHAWKILDLKPQNKLWTWNKKKLQVPNQTHLRKNNPTHFILCKPHLCVCVSHQVLGEVVDELSVVQALIIMEVVLKHGCDLIRSHHRSTHTHCILTRLQTHTKTQSIFVRNKVEVCPAGLRCIHNKTKKRCEGFCVCECRFPTLTTCGFGSTRCNSRLTRTLWIWSLNTGSPEPNLDRFPIRWMEAQRISSFSWMNTEPVDTVSVICVCMCGKQLHQIQQLQHCSW